MRAIPFLALLLAPAVTQATTWTVGPGQNHTLPSQVSTLVSDGDTVDIEAGVYPGDVARWQAHDLLLRGVGGFAHLESNGMSWGDKAIWVIQGDRCTVEWIAFSECAVPDQNGAGIRQEGHDLTVRHCWFHDNENGILAGTVNPSTIRIEHSEFGHNGHGDGQSHNLYINNVDTLIFRTNYCHHAHVGHELKSRARVNIIEYNRFSNEADGDASREIDLPDGGRAFLIGNIIQQGPLGQNSNLVGFALEGFTNPGPHILYAINNTLLNEKPGGSFFAMPTSVLFKGYNNILAGGGTFMNIWPFAPDTLANRTGPIAAFHFTDPLTFDLHLDASSPVLGIGQPAGIGSGYPLVAMEEYVHPMGSTPRCQQATLDAGAYELCPTGIADGPVQDPLLFPQPANDQVELLLPGTGGHFIVELFDGTGRLLLRTREQGPRATLDLGAVSPGRHVLHVQGVDQRYSLPLMVMR
ncbi:MAG TPA: T9SS type A sorting domain-containing protein [Flavobacteriales bacterium]|nr:right-handed parallel beta-helix repeat-containing protein [Flavobacteriales bacterium]HQW86352.1 T9SS type A sorting domain-containing protein [Flavobacteriales bacterium]